MFLQRLIDVLELLTEGQMAKVVRLMRAMKPLRLMKRNQGMRVVIDALLSTLTPVRPSAPAATRISRAAP